MTFHINMEIYNFHMNLFLIFYKNNKFLYFQDLLKWHKSESANLSNFQIWGIFVFLNTNTKYKYKYIGIFICTNTNTLKNKQLQLQIQILLKVIEKYLKYFSITFLSEIYQDLTKGLYLKF